MNEIKINANELLTTAQMSKRLQTTAKTIRIWLREGRLPIPYIKLPNGEFRVRISDLESYLATETVVEPPPAPRRQEARRIYSERFSADGEGSRVENCEALGAPLAQLDRAHDS